MSATPAGNQRLLRIIDSFARQTILVAGDLVADEFVFGEIARVSREAPVLILKRRDSAILPGGGGNAVYNLAALGARALPVGVLGDDAAGHALLARYREQRIPTEGILCEPKYVTTTKTRILAGTIHGSRQQVVRIDREPDGPPPAAARVAVEQRVRKRLAEADAVLLSDYGYGVVTPALAARVRAAAPRLPVTVDSRYDIAGYRGLTAATPNEAELEETFHLQIGTDRDRLERAGRALLRKMRVRALLVTRGRDGMALFEPRRPTLHIPIVGGDQNTDVTGAGDTVIAVFTLALAAGASFAGAARLANFAGGIVVMKQGTATLTADELRAAVRAA
jgi:rfaE bifunctional protein kinase chain/domain